MINRSLILLSPDGGGGSAAVADAPAAAAPLKKDVQVSDSAATELEGLDALDTDGHGKRPEPRRRAEVTKPADKPADKPAEGAKPPDKPADAKPGDKPADKPAEAPLRTAELRTRYDAAKEKIATLEPKVAQLERELAEAKTKTPDIAPIQARATALEQENAALKEEIRYVNYKKHPEFVQKYEQPYKEAWNKAVGEIVQFNIETEAGQTRKATADDFLALANAPLDQVDDLADKWFGKAAPRVIRHVEKIRDLAEAQDKALDEARTQGTERDKRQAAEAQTRNTAVSTAYAGAQKELADKYPKWFAPDPEDKPGNELLEKGYAYADSVLAGTEKMSPEKKVKRLAVIRAKAANHDRIASALKSARQTIADLEADLAEFGKSVPGADRGNDPGRTAGKNFLDDSMSELDALDKKS